MYDYIILPFPQIVKPKHSVVTDVASTKHVHLGGVRNGRLTASSNLESFCPSTSLGAFDFLFISHSRRP